MLAGLCWCKVQIISSPARGKGSSWSWSYSPICTPARCEYSAVRETFWKEMSPVLCHVSICALSCESINHSINCWDERNSWQLRRAEDKIVLWQFPKGNFLIPASPAWNPQHQPRNHHLWPLKLWYGDFDLKNAEFFPCLAMPKAKREKKAGQGANRSWGQPHTPREHKAWKFILL